MPRYGAFPAQHEARHVSGGADAFQSTDLLEAIVKRLRESGGPTTLTLGAVTDGQFLKRSGASLISEAVSVDFPMKLKPALTRYVMPGWMGGLTSGYGMAAGVIYYEPIFVSETTTYTGIGISVSTASAGTADLRIFNWSNGLPSSLVLSAGTVDTGTIGSKVITISQKLTRGYYFLAVRCSGTPGLEGLNTNYCIAPPVPGISTSAGPYIYFAIMTVSAAYSDPAPAPTGMEQPYYAVVYLREN
jgi:hypothetical protein